MTSMDGGRPSYLHLPELTPLCDCGLRTVASRECGGGGYFGGSRPWPWRGSRSGIQNPVKRDLPGWGLLLPFEKLQSATSGLQSRAAACRRPSRARGCERLPAAIRPGQSALGQSDDGKRCCCLIVGHPISDPCQASEVPPAGSAARHPQHMELTACAGAQG